MNLWSLIVLTIFLENSRGINLKLSTYPSPLKLSWLSTQFPSHQPHLLTDISIEVVVPEKSLVYFSQLVSRKTRSIEDRLVGGNKCSFNTARIWQRNLIFSNHAMTGESSMVNETLHMLNRKCLHMLNRKGKLTPTAWNTGQLPSHLCRMLKNTH